MLELSSSPSPKPDTKLPLEEQLAAAHRENRELRQKYKKRVKEEEDEKPNLAAGSVSGNQGGGSKIKKFKVEKAIVIDSDSDDD